MQVVYPRNTGMVPLSDQNITVSTKVIVLTHSQGSLTLAVNPSDGDTMTIGSKVYTFETTLTNVDGNIQIAGTVGGTQANVLNAINLTGTPGTDYAASMTVHPSVYASEAWVGNDLVLVAKTAGTAGDVIATTETFTSGSNVFDGATLGTTNGGVDAQDWANIVVGAQPLRLRHGSDPVAATSGLYLAANTSWMIGSNELADVRLIRDGGSDAPIWVQYYR